MEQDANFTDLAEKPNAEVFKLLSSSAKGFSSAVAAARLRTFGPNRFGMETRAPLFLLPLSKFRSPLLILMMVAAVISGFLGQELNAAIILTIVFVSTFVDFLNTYKSGKAAEALKEKVNITASVWRNGKIKEIRVRDIVPGDVFSLTAGDLVPADSVLLESKDLFVNESVLTGESLPAEKSAEAGASRVVYMGTSVISGMGLALAAQTGASAKIGVIVNRLK